MDRQHDDHQLAERTEKTFRSYVAYRVGEITTEFDPYKDVAYLHSDQNAADLISRGGTVSDMKVVIDGPEYLRLPPESWPRTPENVPVKPRDPERKRFYSRNTHTLARKVNAWVSKSAPIIGATKFSSWNMNISIRVVRSCITCRRHRGKPVYQNMADFIRMSPCSPSFTTT